MKDGSEIKIFLVDDDEIFLKFLEIEFHQNTEFNIEIFTSGELCMKRISQHPDVIILDYHLNGMDKSAMNGIGTLHKIKEYDPNIQVIMLSSQDEIEVAINSVHHKAIDYVVKGDAAFLRIQKIISTILSLKNMEKGLRNG